MSSIVIAAFFIFFTQNSLSQTELNECPSVSSSEKLEEWRNKAISIYSKGEYRTVSSALETCFQSKPPVCMKELADEVGQGRSNSRYMNLDSLPRVEPMTLKSEKDLPSEFLVKDSSGVVKDGIIKIPDDIIKLAKEKKWEALSYKTRSTGGFDNPPNLLMVVIPGRDKDIYIQTSPHGAGPQDNDHSKPNLTKEELAKGQNVLTVITVDKTVNPPVGQLRLLEREPRFTRGDVSTSVATDLNGYRWSNRLQTQSCLECHSTPLRSISPMGYKVTNGSEKKMSTEDQATTSRINEMMVINNLSWGKVRTADGREVKLGHDQSLRPAGWITPGTERTEDDLKKCSTRNTRLRYSGFGSYTYEAVMSALPNLDYAKVRQSMDCTQCHNGTIRGPLNRSFSDAEIKFKILVDRSMPPGAELNDDERLALYNCLSSEKYDSKLDKSWAEKAEWLKKEACVAISSGRTSRMNLSSPNATQSVPRETLPSKTGR